MVQLYSFNMLKFLLLMSAALLTNAEKLDPVSDQIAVYKEKTKGSIGIMTTKSGAPVESRDAGSTLNTNLPQNEHFMNTMMHFVRERIPVRVVHSKGAGAFGYFKTTKDMSHICRAEFMCGVGKKTPIAARFSPALSERGEPDLVRLPRGFAVKFYTTEGNFDMAGFSVPIFSFRDPSLFTALVHGAKRNPATDLPDVNGFWDLISIHPEAILGFLIVFSDKGIHDGYRNMPGHSIHTYPFYNAAGNITLGRFHFRPIGGYKYLNSTEAARLSAKDPSYCARDLYEAIASCNYPTWNVYLQLLPDETLKKAKIDPYDVNKIMPEKLFPWIKIGEIVLNRSPKNHFAEVEQMAFGPGNLVPGILGSPDKVFETRRIAYRDAAQYRLGVNYDRIPVNFPYRSKFLTYNRDGLPPVGDNGYDGPNYYPNSFNGPIPYVDKNRPPVPKIYEAEANNIDQAREYYENNIVGNQRNILAQNIAASLSGTVDFIQDQVIEVFKKVNDDLASRVAKALKEENCKN